MSGKQLDLLKTPPDDAAVRIARAAFAAILTARDGNPAFRLTEAALVDCLRPALAKEFPKAVRTPRVNGRNPLFDALAAACGFTEPHTKSAGGQVARALKEVLEIDPTATPEEITRTASAVLRKYEGAGPIAVSAHWHEFSSARRKRDAKATEKGPDGWLKRLNELYPDSTLATGGRFAIDKETDYAWAQLAPSLRAELATALR